MQKPSLELIYPDAKDCAVSLYVSGYEEAPQRLRIAGVSAKELDENRPSFDRGQEVRFSEELYSPSRSRGAKWSAN